MHTKSIYVPQYAIAGKYFIVGEKRQIQIPIYLGGQKRANMNTNTNVWTGICEYEYKYKYSSHTVLTPRAVLRWLI